MGGGRHRQPGGLADLVQLGTHLMMLVILRGGSCVVVMHAGSLLYPALAAPAQGYRAARCSLRPPVALIAYLHHTGVVACRHLCWLGCSSPAQL